MPNKPAPGAPSLPGATPRRVSRLALLALLAAALFAAFAAWKGGVFGDEPTDLPQPFPSPHLSWADHIRAADSAIREHHTRGEREETDWLSPSAEAAAWLDRASMTGRWQDYVAAETALDTAMARGGPSTRPYPLAARLALALHRDARVEPALEAAKADRQFALHSAQADAALLRGDVALHRGDWHRADAEYARSATLLDNAPVRFRRAFLIERTRNAEEARTAWIAAANRDARPSRRMLSFAAMRLGNLELARGDWDEADRWYARAERLLPGDWHVVALRLQMRALRGDLSGAVDGMTRLATQHELPELWDALASWRRAAGDSAGSREALARAEAGWAAWLDHFPEAAAGHAAEHALLAGDEVRALTLARANHANRPYGETATLLATALSANGRVEEALALVRRTRATGWHSTELDRLAFELTLLSGDAAGAEKVRADALARNPRAFDPAAPLIRFGLH